MTLDLAKIFRMNDFKLELKSLGSVICTALTAGHFSEIETQLTKPHKHSIDVLRFLFSDMARKSREDVSDTHDLSNDPPFTALELSTVTDAEIEEFADRLCQKYLYIFSISKGKYLEREINEASSEYFIRGIRHHLTEQRARLKQVLAPYSAIQNLAIRKSGIEAHAEASRYRLNTSATEAITQQFERDRDSLRMATSQSEAARVYVEQQASNLAMVNSFFSNGVIAKEATKKLVIDQNLSSFAFNQLSQQREAHALYKNHDAIFRLPEKSEVSHLLANCQLGTLAEFAEIQRAEQKRFVESITSPWINSIEIGRSVSAILELQGLGNALRTTQGFDSELTDALRSDFGDWRDKIDFAKFELVNPVVRTDFYIARGFNPALTDLPEEAFDQSLELVGLNSHSLDVQPYGEYNQQTENLDVEVGLQRTNECHDILQRFERNLRKFINDLMVRQYGDDWPKKKLHSDTYGKWKEKRTKAEKHGDTIPLIELIDFTEYEPIICQNDHWNDIFVKIFKRKESVKESFQRLYPIRLATMHSRIVTKEDKLYLYAETVRILRAVNLLQR